MSVPGTLVVIVSQFHFPKPITKVTTPVGASTCSTTSRRDNDIPNIWTSYTWSIFLAIQNSSIGDLVTDFRHTNSDPRDLWPLRHLFRVRRKQDLTNILIILDNLDFLLKILKNFDNLILLIFFTFLMNKFYMFDIFDNF